MSRLLAGAMATVLAGGLALSLGNAAIAAPIGALKQFKVPTADSQPRAITNGSDGNRWFTEGTEFTSAPAKIARITPAGVITQTTKGNIARIDNAGVITEAKAVKGSQPFGITVALNGDPWYTMFAASKIATLQLR